MGLLSKSTDLTKRKDAPMERSEARTPVAPAVDVYENGEEVLLLADVPGASQEGISVHLDQGQLTIRARRADDTYGQALLGEFRPTDYERAFSVPQGIDASRIDAELRSGVLRVHLPKSESQRPKIIPVRASA